MARKISLSRTKKSFFLWPLVLFGLSIRKKRRLSPVLLAMIELIRIYKKKRKEKKERKKGKGKGKGNNNTFIDMFIETTFSCEM